MASSELKKRVLTGVVGGSLFLLLLLFGGWIGIYLLTLVLVLGMVWEFSKIVLQQPDREEKLYLMMFLAWFLVIADLANPFWQAEALTTSFVILSLYFLLSAGRQGPTHFAGHLRDLTFSLFGLIYLVVLPLFLPRIHGMPRGELWAVLFFLIVWLNDTAAYFVGKKYGRRKLYPTVSPQKTVEGALGGLVGGLLVSLVFGALFLRGNWSAIVIAPLIVGPAAQAGDLVESLFKRAFEVKDSGSILPGHGGFLDRFDGVVFALPVMYAVLRLFA
ncbi:MAG: hypothetical protein A2X94_16550 [Bdellovibrionales bacterium GWB1_55_8]|nr:MAG: hypothetical protein A2X94_16550 [Bdellovibrionales bacterium GWB1_55_8]